MRIDKRDVVGKPRLSGVLVADRPTGKCGEQTSPDLSKDSHFKVGLKLWRLRRNYKIKDDRKITVAVLYASLRNVIYYRFN